MFAFVLHRMSNWLHQIVCIRLCFCQHPLLSYKQMKLRGPGIRVQIQWSHWRFIFASIIFTPISWIEYSAGSAQFVSVFIFAVCLAALLASLLKKATLDFRTVDKRRFETCFTDSCSAEGSCVWGLCVRLCSSSKVLQLFLPDSKR